MSNRDELKKQLKLAINSRKISRMSKAFKEAQIIELRQNVEKMMKET